MFFEGLASDLGRVWLAQGIGTLQEAGPSPTQLAPVPRDLGPVRFHALAASAEP